MISRDLDKWSATVHEINVEKQNWRLIQKPVCLKPRLQFQSARQIKSTDWELNLSWTAIIVGDDQEVGVAHEVKSPDKQPQFSQTTMEQYRLININPKQAFKLTQNAFKKLPRNFNNF